MSDYKQFYNLSEASELYGVSKSTMSRAVHKTDGKGLSHEKKDGEILIGIDELIRHYGTPEEYRQKKNTKKQRIARNRSEVDETEQGEQNETGAKATYKQDRAQIAVMQAKLEHAEELLQQERIERQREREQAQQQQAQTLEQIEKWQQQAESQTRLLTDEREKATLPLWQKIFGKK